MMSRVSHGPCRDLRSRLPGAHAHETAPRERYHPPVPSPTVALLQPDLKALLEAHEFREVRESLRALAPVDVGEIIESMVNDGDSEPAAVAFRLLPRDEAADVFSHLATDTQQELINELGEDAAWRIVDAMTPDDRAALIDELPLEVAQPLLARLPAETRKQVQAILGYPPESVGRLITTEYVRLKPQWTVGRALDHIRHYGSDAETLHWVYVVDADGRLIDDLYIRQLLLADPAQTIEAIMDRTFVSLNATDDREMAVRELARYDRSAMPVIDSRGHLVGIVTFDDVSDVAQIEATEDMHLLAGVETLERSYLATGLPEMLRKRSFWLGLLLVMQVGTITVMAGFERQLEVVVLSLFIPMILSSGGNSGTQAATLLVRAMALDEVRLADWLRVLGREVVTGLVLGLGLGLMALLLAFLAQWLGIATSDDVRPWRVAMIVGAAVHAIIVWGTFVGAMLPFGLKRLGIDPATSSSPLVSTIMDVSGLSIYMFVAMILL